jgi:hypothetical protein
MPDPPESSILYILLAYRRSDHNGALRGRLIASQYRRSSICYIVGVESWLELQRSLLPLGFKTAVYVSFTCREHGRFRAAIQDPPRRYPCPECNCPCRPSLLALGLTQRKLPVVEKTGLESPRRIFQAKLKFPNPAVSKFERMVHKSRLDDRDPESLTSSDQLRSWAKSQRENNFIPEWLLANWRLTPSPAAERAAAAKAERFAERMALTRDKGAASLMA